MIGRPTRLVRSLAVARFLFLVKLVSSCQPDRWQPLWAPQDGAIVGDRQEARLWRFSTDGAIRATPLFISVFHPRLERESARLAGMRGERPR